MSTRKPRPATVEYSVHDRADKLPKVGDTLQLGRQAFQIASLRLRIELRPVGTDDEEADDE